MEITTNYKKQFLEYVLANVLSMLGMSVYILADTFFISKGLGANGLTALNLALPIYNFIEGSGQMIGIGGASMFIIFHYQGKRRDSDSVFSTAVVTGLFLGLMFLMAGIFFADEIAMMLGANQDVYDMTYTYLHMLLMFAPAFILNNIMSAFVKNDGAPKLAMAGMLAGSIFNSIFDYIFIFRFKLGMFGAVLATACAPVVGMLILSSHFWRKRNHFRLQLRFYRIRMLPTLLSRGVPTLITEMATGIVMIAFNTLILGINGNVGVAAYGIILNVYLVIIAIFNGVAQGSQPLFGALYAKNDHRGRKITFRYAVIAVAIISAIVYVAAFVFPVPLVEIFNSEGNALMAELAVHGFRLYFIGTFFLGCNIVMLIYFISIGKDRIALWASLGRGVIIILPMAVLLSRLLGIDGIWLAAPITELIVWIPLIRRSYTS